MPYTPMSSMAPNVNGQRNSIAAALMNVAKPRPRTAPGVLGQGMQAQPGMPMPPQGLPTQPGMPPQGMPQQPMGMPQGMPQQPMGMPQTQPMGMAQGLPPQQQEAPQGMPIGQPY